MDFALLKKELIADEGRKKRVYIDTKGKVTGGIGHNFTDNELSDAVIDLLYTEGTNKAIAQLDLALPWWRNLSEKRQRVLVNMCFNMGIGDDKDGLLSFHKALAAMKAGDFKTAAKEMLDSEWAQPAPVGVGDRARRLADWMEEG